MFTLKPHIVFIVKLGTLVLLNESFKGVYISWTFPDCLWTEYSRFGVHFQIPLICSPRLIFLGNINVLTRVKIILIFE